MTPTQEYLAGCSKILANVASQEEAISIVSERFAKTILSGRMVHVFGSGHSRIMVEEMWPRYGSFPGFHPMVELSLSFHHPVVGSNGQRQAMFLENVPGFAERILRNYDIEPIDSALVVSSSGCNIVPIEIAEGFQSRGVHVTALVSVEHCNASKSQQKDGKKLTDFASVVLDTGAPIGDSMVYLEELDTPVSPGSTIGGCMVVNAIKAEVGQRLLQSGHIPKVLTSAAIVGAQRARELFESAYDEHGRRLAKLYSSLGA